MVLSSPIGEPEWYVLHEKGLVEDEAGLYRFGTSLVKANVCSDCAAVLHKLKKGSQRRSAAAA